MPRGSGYKICCQQRSSETVSPRRRIRLQGEPELREHDLSYESLLGTENRRLALLQREHTDLEERVRRSRQRFGEDISQAELTSGFTP